MATCRCIVSFTDTDGIVHEAQVYATTVYSAVGEALREWRSGGVMEVKTGPLTEFTVLVHRSPVSHKIQLQQVTAWAKGAARSPAEQMDRRHLRRVMKLESEE